jgi:rubredoxin
MICSFCTHSFTEEDGFKSCGKCASFGGCRLIKCPRCGYEMPQTPGLIKLLQNWNRRRTDAAR